MQAFRGCGKSWITSAYVLWCLYHNPQEKILVVSASKTRSDDFSTFTQRLIREVPILQFLEPGTNQRNSKIAFDVGPADASHAPSVKSAGIFGQLAGSRATRIIADDVEVPNNSATEDMREKLLRAVSEFEAILIPEGDTQIIFLGTPQTEESVYNKLNTEREYPCRVWPVRVPEEDHTGNYKGLLAPSFGGREPWEPIEPSRFPNDVLHKRMASYGRSGFMLQFMLDTSLSDSERYPLKLNDLIVAQLDKEEPPTRVAYASGPEQTLKEFPQIGFSGDRWNRPLLLEYKHTTQWNSKILVVDPAGRGADKTAYCVLGHHNDKIYLLEAGGYDGGYEEKTVLEPLAWVAKDWKVNRVLIESNFGDGMFGQILTPIMNKIYKCSMEEVRHNTQKEARIIDTLEPVMNSHRLVVNHSVVKVDIKQHTQDMKYSLFHQMTRITRERGALRHDDALDCLAMGVAWYTKLMALDEDEEIQARNQELFEKEIEVFMEGILGRPKDQGKGSKWCLR